MGTALTNADGTITDPWKATSLHPVFGAEISGYPPLSEWSPADGQRLSDFVGRYGIALLRGHDPTKQEFADWSRNLGSLWTPPIVKGRYVADATLPVLLITNLDADGKIIPANPRFEALSLANQLWHTDATFVRPGASISSLLGLVVPPEGADTDFCDTRVAYEQLPETKSDRLHDMVAWHSYLHSRTLAGFTDWNDEDREALPSIPHPLVRWHHPSKRHSIVLASHIEKIDGLSPEQSKELVDELMEVATIDANVYTHKWRKGDIILWDNRCTMHRATPFDHNKYGRSMWSTRVVESIC